MLNSYQRIILPVLIAMIFASCQTQNLFQGQSTKTQHKYQEIKINSKKEHQQTSYHQKHSTDSSFFEISADWSYIIRKDDKISISVWDHDNLSVGSLYGIYNSNEVYGKWLLVNSKGQINVPKIGTFTIRGLTVVQAQDSLKLLFSEWVINPIVEVKVLNKEITVLGEVKSPGKFLVEKDYNPLIEILAKAGDFDFYANKRKIKVIRMVDKEVKEIVIDLTKMENFAHKNILLLPGDIVYVPSKAGKDFDKRIATIIPFASIATAFAITYGTFF